MDPIYSRRDLSAAEHRLIWFLLEAGATERALGQGWITVASRSMGMHRHSVRNLVHKLADKGVVTIQGRNAPKLWPMAFKSEVINVRDWRGESAQNPAA